MPWRMISSALGMAEGGALRSLLANLCSELGLDQFASKSPAHRRAAFTAAVIALSAKLAKSDGVALRIEAEAFEQVFHVPRAEVASARRLFDITKQDVAGFEAYAEEVARRLVDRPDLKRDIFDALLHIASADGVLHQSEDAYLSAVAEKFDYSPAEYRALRARFVHDVDDPYVVLGVPHSITDDALKAHYKQLVRENHPDALAAHGVPKEFADVAERKLAAINAAFDEIAKERGL